MEKFKIFLILTYFDVVSWTKANLLRLIEKVFFLRALFLILNWSCHGNLMVRHVRKWNNLCQLVFDQLKHKNSSPPLVTGCRVLWQIFAVIDDTLWMLYGLELSKCNLILVLQYDLSILGNVLQCAWFLMILILI